MLEVFELFINSGKNLKKKIKKKLGAGAGAGAGAGGGGGGEGWCAQNKIIYRERDIKISFKKLIKEDTFLNISIPLNLIIYKIRICIIVFVCFYFLLLRKKRTKILKIYKF